MARLSGPEQTQRSSPEGTQRSGRGQMLLIGAFVLAVMFVALALVVNSAIFTENLASRNHAGGADDALQARYTIATGVGEAMEVANVHNNSDWTVLTDNVSDATETIGLIVGREYAANGRFLGVEATNHEEGTRIADNITGGSTFEGRNGAGNWTVAQGIRARAFVMEINHTHVTAGGDTFGGTVTDEFYVTITDGPNDWRVNVTDRSDDFVVGVRNASGGSGICTATGSPDHVAIDLTAGTVDGRDCHAMTFAEGVGPSYDVEFNESDLVVGNYSLVVDEDFAGFSNAEVHSGLGAGVSGEPYADLAVYSTMLRFQYDAPTVHYGTDVRVAPGEPE